MGLKEYLEKKKDCFFCKITRYAIVFALGVVSGMLFIIVQEMLF